MQFSSFFQGFEEHFSEILDCSFSKIWKNPFFWLFAFQSISNVHLENLNFRFWKLCSFFQNFWWKTAKYPLLGYTAQFLDNLRYYFHFSVKNCQKYSIQNQNLRPLSHSQGCYGHLKMLLNLVQKGAKIRILAIFWFLRCLLC